MNSREMFRQARAKHTNAQTQVRQPNKQMVENVGRRSLLKQQKAVQTATAAATLTTKST